MILTDQQFLLVLQVVFIARENGLDSEHSEPDHRHKAELTGNCDNHANIADLLPTLCRINREECGVPNHINTQVQETQNRQNWGATCHGRSLSFPRDENDRHSDQND